MHPLKVLVRRAAEFLLISLGNTVVYTTVCIKVLGAYGVEPALWQALIPCTLLGLFSGYLCVVVLEAHE